MVVTLGGAEAHELANGWWRATDASNRVAYVIRRNGGSGTAQGDQLLDDLIRDLESGSARAEVHLRGIAATETAEDTCHGETGNDETGHDDRADMAEGGAQSSVLDAVARSAAAGSPYALELLLGLVVEHDLSGPAIGRVTRGRSAVEDIQQEVLVNVARSIHRYRGEARFTTWLYALSRNVAVSHLRKLRPTEEIPPEELLDDGSPRRMSSLVTERDVVRAAIDSLPSVFRQVVVLRDIEGLSYAEIAERLGLEINTVRSRLSRGRAMLALKLP